MTEKLNLLDRALWVETNGFRVNMPLTRNVLSELSTEFKRAQRDWDIVSSENPKKLIADSPEARQHAEAWQRLTKFFKVGV